MKELIPHDEGSEKAAFLESFEERYKDEFLPQSWSDDKKDKMLSIMDKKTTDRAMLTAIPMVCRGPNCDFAKNCPLQKKNEAPVGFPCPYELAIVKNTMEDFIESLNVDTNNKIEMNLIRDMVNQEVQYHRATKLLAQESFIQENFVGVDSDGAPVARRELNVAVEYEDKIFKRRQVLFKHFMATRAEAAKYVTAAMNSAEGLSALMSQVAKAQRTVDEQIKEKLGLSDYDDYIEADTRENSEPESE